jgi:hypothetical protein
MRIVALGEPQPAASALGPARHDHMHPCLMTDVRSPGPPSDVRGPVSGVQTDITRTGFRTPHARSCLDEHVHLLRARHCRTGRDADRRRTIGTAAFGHPPIITPRKTARRTPDPFLWGRRLRLGNQ